jgi:hypothetical protein
VGTLVAIALVAILGALAVLHFAWATGRGPSLVGVVPTESGRPLFRPGPLACIAVGSALLVAALLCAVRASWLLPGLPGWLSQTGVAGVALAFALRAIGDFRRVGFSKRFRDGEFARRDTWLYSPLCVLISGLALLLAFGRHAN